MVARLTRPVRGLKPLQNSCINPWISSHTAKRTLHLSSQQSAKAKNPLPRSPPPTKPAIDANPLIYRTSKQAAQSPNTSLKPPAANGEKATVDTIFQQRKWAFMGAGFAALALGFYITSVVASLVKSPTPSCAAGACANPATAGPNGTPLMPTGRPPGLEQAKGDERRLSAETFDRELDVPEFIGGYKKLRKEMGKWARGRVLEVAVGTGRNLPYYDWTELVEGVMPLQGEKAEAEREKLRKEKEKREQKRARKVKRAMKAKGEEVDVEKAKLPGRFDGEMLSYTGVDISADMMGVARTRLRDTVPGLKMLLRRIRAEPMPERGTVVDILDSRVRLCIADAQEPLPLPPPTTAAPPDADPGKYDTIFQSFGLCSVSDPVKLLSNMASAVQPGTGRIFLLEHGRGYFDFLNRWLDQTSEKHFNKHGCWWNRDIEAIVQEAARTVPGLEVVHLGRPLLRMAGTTLVIELRVNPDAVAQKT
ncbi:S-adenosyl-L-methionine-dependent methyltransferase [Coniochaeta sp. 2T2.1]|nr:S-adenosyl-L-methionine-dependent methyltransferase [Coniochaeta sp. 2T2.1]